jgi:hypothetical protein
MDEGNSEVPAEGLDDLESLLLPEKPVVDEDARELLPHRLVHEERCHGRVDAAGERAQHARSSDLGANARGLLLDDRSRSPHGRRVGHAVEEVLEEIGSVRRVHHLGVELHAVQAPLRVLEGCDRSRRRAGDDARALGRGHNRVAVAHPAELLRRQACEEAALWIGLELRPAELGDPRSLDAAAEVERHELHAVADPEHGHAQLEEAGVDMRCSVRVHGRGTAGENERERPLGARRRRGDAMADELRVNAAFAHAARDQLRVLPAEVDDEDGTFFWRRLRGGERDDLAHAAR